MKEKLLMGLKTSLLLISTAGLFIGCKKEDKDVRHYQVPKPSTASTTEAPPHVPTTTPEFTWTVPNNWQETDASSSMRLATFVQDTDHGQAECSVFELSGKAGGLVDNVNRWRQQLGLTTQTPEEITQSARTLNGPLGEIQVFELVNKDTPKRAFLAAIIPLADSTFFVKVACPAGAIPSVKPLFERFCQSIKKN